jgi:hypothetical protein
MSAQGMIEKRTTIVAGTFLAFTPYSDGEAAETRAYNRRMKELAAEDAAKAGRFPVEADDVLHRQITEILTC